MVFGTSNKNSDQEQQNEEQRQLFSFRRKSSTTENAETTTSSAKSVRNSFIAGWTAGITGTIAGHPLDSLKVWMQTGGSSKGPAGPSSSTSSTATSTSVASPSSIFSSVRRFYAGVTGPLLTVGLIQSVNFAVYDSTRRFWYYNFDDPDADPALRGYMNHDSYTSIAVAGATAGAVVSLITSPVLQIKTKQQTQNMKFRQALTHTLRHPTVGFGTHFFVETANRAVYFCTYEYLKRYYTNKDDGTVPLTGRMISAAAAGIACWAVLYPADVLRSRLYASSAKDHQIPARDMIRIMNAEQGWRSFYRGYAVTTLRAGPVAAAILPVYDLVLDQLNSLPY